jgi:hypothetical protein
VTADELAASAQALLAAGDAAGAIGVCRQALIVDPDCLAAHVCMARAKRPGDDYLVWLARFHAELRPATYLEIGVDAGRTLSLARPPTLAIGVDPTLSASPPPFAAATRTFAMESDAFFASPEVDARLGPAPVALAFVDGLHLFEQALRDFLHVERHAARGSVVLFHDCLPLDRATSSRERRTGFWSGDVWKLAPILREHRPDLDVFVIPAYPTGLGVVTRLDPSSRVLTEHLGKIAEAWTPREWSDAPGAEPPLPLVANDGPAVLARIRGAGARSVS